MERGCEQNLRITHDASMSMTGRTSIFEDRLETRNLTIVNKHLKSILLIPKFIVLPHFNPILFLYLLFSNVTRSLSLESLL